jgi:hypothetical protein
MTYTVIIITATRLVCILITSLNPELGYLGLSETAFEFSLQTIQIPLSDVSPSRSFCDTRRPLVAPISSAYALLVL